MSEYVPHRVRHLGISNAPHAVVRYLLESPEIAVKPSVVQNRFYGDTRYEVGLRALCRDRGVAFQTFWTLTGNPSLVRSAPYVADLAAAAGVEREVAFYALVLGLGGTSILDGTKNAAHMREDLEGLEKVGRWAEQSPGRELWEEALGKFKAAIGEEREHVEEEGDED
ncbi:hypothetical protein BX600DRAFT_449652 [Xylariales sp. PMI_506]|nr:hypothetical protein BX600DRAFT_449652 [Xylariales sp. PMI_506]